MEPCTTDHQPDPSTTMDSDSSPTAADPAAETHPQAEDDDDQDTDSLFNGKTPAFESQTQSPAQVLPEDQDSHESHTEPQTQPDGRPETQPRESQQQQQTQPARSASSSDGDGPLTGNTSTPSDGHPSTNTTANNDPSPGSHSNLHPRPAPSPHPNGVYRNLGPSTPDPGPKPMPPAPAVHGPFTYDQDGFKALGFKRETPYNLNMIMRDPNAVPPIEPVAKAWFHAQLLHYGIPVHQSSHSAEPLPGALFYALETSLRTEVIKEGKLPPADILTIEDNLKRQFEDIFQQYIEAFKYWEQQTFARCATPTDEINCSVDLFMAKYFLKGIRGGPDPRKTRYPIILHKLNDYDGTRKVVKAVPGLRSHMMPLWSVICWEEYGIERAIEEAFASIAASHPSITIHVPTMEAHFHIDYFLSKYWLTGVHGRPMPMLTPEPVVIEGWFGGPDIRNILTHAVLRVPDLRVWAFIGNGMDKTVIGWGDKPFELIEHLRSTSMRQQVASAAPQRVEIQGNPTWEWALQAHFRLCQVKANLLQTNPQKAYEPFEIEELVGSWLVQCPALEDGGWGGRPGEMTIDILNWPVDSYGLVASINLKVALGTMILAKSESLLDELSAYLLHDPEDLPHIPHKKRRRGDDFFVEYPRRRSPYDPMPPVRVFFDWIGRRTNEFDVELDMDPANRNRGWVDIDMNNKAIGKGWLKYVKFFGKDNPVAFSMYKVMDQPRKMPEQWSNFRPRQMEAQLQRRTEEQLQRPIAQPKQIMITSKIPPPASDHTLPPLPPPRPAPPRPPPPPRLAPPPPRPPSPPPDIPGFPRIRPRDPHQGIQIGVHTIPPKKRRGPKRGYNEAPPGGVVQKQGNGVSREGGDGQEETDTSTSTPMEGQGHGDEYGLAEEEGLEGEQQEGEQRDDGSPHDGKEQVEEEEGRTQDREQEEGTKGQGEGPDKTAQEEEDQEQEDEDDLQTYETPAEEVASALDAQEQPNDSDGQQGQQEGQTEEDDHDEEQDDDLEEEEDGQGYEKGKDDQPQEDDNGHQKKQGS